MHIYIKILIVLQTLNKNAWYMHKNDFISFICATLHFIDTGKIGNFSVETDSNSIKLSWINSTEDENCTADYTIEWKNITDGKRNGCDITGNKSCVIEGLEACVTFEVSVSALCVNKDVSELGITYVTTLPVGKWQVMCRFMACMYTTSSSEGIEYSHQLKILLQISCI